LYSRLCCYRQTSSFSHSLNFSPTRRSSDLGPPETTETTNGFGAGGRGSVRSGDVRTHRRLHPRGCRGRRGSRRDRRGRRLRPPRSEEHTSELQSRENLVCRLLLEKKKQQYQ